MKNFILFSLSLIFIFPLSLSSQDQGRERLPKGFSERETILMERNEYLSEGNIRNTTSTPPSSPMRSMAEWEEMQALVITWTGFDNTLQTDIVKYAQEEVEVIIVANANQQNGISSILQNAGVPLNNVTFVTDNYDSVWVRDYGGNPVYSNDVDSLYFVDWIYNRPRPNDDAMPESIANYFGTTVYETGTAPTDLVHTGGNFMSDGLGIAFSSDLVLDENGTNNQWGTSNHDENDVNQIMEDFMGIEEYIIMDKLLYDGISHIDMHMKLIDEQTLLIGQFPDGISDGPQLEANIQYIVDNFQTSFGTDFRIERIVQPPCGNGNYPPNCTYNAEYRTYTNAMFINKTILVPIYNTSYDDEALQKWREMMPGYKVRGIDCTDIITYGGAIHCITKEVGVDDPLWIAHAELPDLTEAQNTNDYEVNTIIKHRSDIANATLFWTIDTLSGYTSTNMTLSNVADDIWTAMIPQQANGEEVFYYIHAEANSGKTMVRPIVAPDGYFNFEIFEMSTSNNELDKASFSSIGNIYPNPTSGSAIIPVDIHEATQGSIILNDVLGRQVKEIFNGNLQAGETNHVLETNDLSRGVYFVVLSDGNRQSVKRLVVK